MNEELTLAIEELRQRPTNRAWFIPVLLAECAVPERSIGAGETLQDLQWVDLQRNWDDGIIKIVGAIDPEALIAPLARVWELDEGHWQFLLDRLLHKRCIPVLGRGINYELGLTGEVLAHKIARAVGKPEWMRLPFSQIAERIEEYAGLAFLIDVLQDEYARVRLSEFDIPPEPHATLARLPREIQREPLLKR